MQQQVTSLDRQAGDQAASRAASLSLNQLAALLNISLDGANIDQRVSFTLRRVQQGMALYRAGDQFGPIYAIRSGTFKNVLPDANGSYQVLGFPMASDVLGLDGIEAQHYRTEAVALEDSEVAIIPFPRLARLGAEMDDPVEVRPELLQTIVAFILVLAPAVYYSAELANNYAEIIKRLPDEIKMVGVVASPDGSALKRGERSGKFVDAAKLGAELAEELLRAGADRILASV